MILLLNIGTAVEPSRVFGSPTVLPSKTGVSGQGLRGDSDLGLDVSKLG